MEPAKQMAVVCSEGELDTTRTDGLLSLSQVVVRERTEEKPSEAGQTQHFQSGLRCRGTKSSGPSPAGFAVADLDLAFSGCLVIKTKKKKHEGGRNGRTGWHIEEIPDNKVYREVKERCQKSGWGWF